MAGIGLSKPYVALYSFDGTDVAYSNGATVGKAVTLDLSLEDGNSNILYGDNGPAEIDNKFAGGELTLTTTELLADEIAKILGLTEIALSIPGMTTASASEIQFGDAQNTPYVGFGAIAKKMIDGDIKYVGIVYPKVMFQNMSETLNTQGDTIEWQTPEISAQISRDDTSAHNWKRMSSPLDTEADALLYIQYCLGGGSASE